MKKVQKIVSAHNCRVSFNLYIPILRLSSKILTTDFTSRLEGSRLWTRSFTSYVMMIFWLWALRRMVLLALFLDSVHFPLAFWKKVTKLSSNQVPNTSLFMPSKAFIMGVSKVLMTVCLRMRWLLDLAETVFIKKLILTDSLFFDSTTRVFSAQQNLKQSIFKVHILDLLTLRQCDVHLHWFFPLLFRLLLE